MMTRDSIARERIKALARLMDAISIATDKANRIALEAAEKAVLKAENANERRFEGVNEFRQTLSDQAAQFITRKEVEALLNAVNGAIGRLETTSSNASGKGIGMGMMWGWIVGGIGLAAAVVSVFK
jgi:hypothetical protein